MLDTSIQVKTDHFDGPLGLLLLLIQKEEMDIYKFDLTEITKQYLSYLDHMRELNFDVAGEYLYLAATLILLKSKSCITEEENRKLKEENGGDELAITSKSELIRRLEELQHYQKMGEKIWSLPKRNQDIFVKPKVNRKAIVNSILTPMDLNQLTTAMMDFMRKQKRKYSIVKRDRLSIKEKLVYLKEFLVKDSRVTFRELLSKDGEQSIDDVIITFISLLELARLKKLSIFQNEENREIYVNVLESLDDFNVDLADGFEDEDDEDAFNEELKDTIDSQVDDNQPNEEVVVQ